MQKVIFICRRNRMRSQMAEAIYNNLIGENGIAESYGIDTLSEEIGREFSNFPKVINTVNVMKEHGIDLSKKFVKQLKPDNIKDFSKIIVVTKKEDVPEWLKEYPLEFWDVYDPPGVPTVEQTEEIYKILENNIKKLLSI